MTRSAKLRLLASWLRETYGTEASRVSGVPIATLRAVASGSAGWVPEEIARRIISAVLISSPRVATPADLQAAQRTIFALGYCPRCGKALPQPSTKPFKFCSTRCKKRTWDAVHNWNGAAYRRKLQSA